MSPERTKTTDPITRVAITGGASGIGRQIALEAVARGVKKLWLIDRDETKLASVCAELSTSCELQPKAIDVTDRTAVAQIGKEWMGDAPHLVVNCAGIHAGDALVGDVTDDDWDDAILTNLTGTFLFLRAGANAMLHNDIAGVIVNIASTAAVMGFSNRVPYCASKAGVIGLTKAAALDLAPRGIRVLAISPGFQRSGISDDLDESVVAKSVPLGRRGEPSELATLLFDLANSSYVTGTNIVIDGGMTTGKFI